MYYKEKMLPPPYVEYRIVGIFEASVCLFIIVSPFALFVTLQLSVLAYVFAISNCYKLKLNNSG